MDSLLSNIAARIFALLGLIAIPALIWQWYSNDRIATTFAHLQQASSQLWPYYRSQPTRFGTSLIPAATIISLRALPDTAICGTALCNEFGGVWQFTGATNSLQAAIDNVSNTDCTRLVTQVPASTGVTQIRIGGTIAAVAAAAANPAPVPADTAASLCAAGTNAVQFTVSRIE